MYKETIKSTFFGECNIIRCNWIQYNLRVHNIPELGQLRPDATLNMVLIPTKPWHILLLLQWRHYAFIQTHVGIA